MGSIESFLHAIPVAAKSPYALIAYIVSALLFIASLHQRNQLKRVLTKIESLPETERKSVIELTLNRKLPEKLSGEQFLRREKTQYVFLAFIAILILFGGITTIALVIGSGNASASTAKIVPLKRMVKVQLWPRPEIRRKFLKDHDAHLYLKTDSTQLELTSFVPTDDFLSQDVDVDDGLIGRPVDVTITPREKYIVQQDRRFLTTLVRFEVYPLGKKPVPVITSAVTPSGEKVYRTTDLPLVSSVPKLHLSDLTPFDIEPSRSYLVDVGGKNLSSGVRISVVNEKGLPVFGTWVGNEPGTDNGKPAEVGADGKHLRVYLRTPPSAAGEKLFFRVGKDGEIDWGPQDPQYPTLVMAPLTVVPTSDKPSS